MTARKPPEARRRAAAQPIVEKPVVQGPPSPAEQTEPPSTSWHLRSTRLTVMPEKREYFYDGELDVFDGDAYVPKEHANWAHRLLQQGYGWPDGKVPYDFDH